MIVKKVKIENFGSVKRSVLRLRNKFTVLSGVNAEDCLIAIAGGLSYPTKNIGDFVERRGDSGFITYYVDDIEEIEKLNNDSILGASKEYMSCSIFCNSDNEKFDERLHRYLKSSDYYSRSDFDKLTNSFGGTKTFRSYLHHFIDDFKPYILSQEKQIEIYIDKEGYFKVRRVNSTEEVLLSSQEKVLFNLFCFKTMHDFWEGAAELRSLQGPNMPLIVGNTLEYLDFDYSRYESTLKRVLKTGSQVILFTTANVDNVPLLVHNKSN